MVRKIYTRRIELDGYTQTTYHDEQSDFFGGGIVETPVMTIHSKADGPAYVIAPACPVGLQATNFDYAHAFVMSALGATDLVEAV